MVRSTRIGRRAAAALMAVAVVSTAGFLLACATGGGDSRPSAPGLYDLTGWNGWNSDINGEVGHRMYVGGPTASCRPGGKWTAGYRIVSGSLPPGLSFRSGGHGIEGIPQQRGHWIIKLELQTITCEGKTYKGLEQELRFHITGSGRVVQ